MKRGWYGAAVVFVLTVTVGAVVRPRPVAPVLAARFAEIDRRVAEGIRTKRAQDRREILGIIGRSLLFAAGVTLVLFAPRVFT